MKSSIIPCLGAGLALAGLTATAAKADTYYAVTQYSYNHRGQVVCTAVRMNTATFGALPADACTAATEGAQGPDRISKAVYDAAGQVAQQLQAYGTPVQRAYATYAYSANGKPTDSIDANGNRTHMAYDAFDRLSHLYYPAAARPSYNPSTPASALATAGAYNSADYEQYAYDNRGNKTWHRVRDGRALNFQYDSLDRQITKYASDASIRSVHTLYDLRGLIQHRRFDGTGGPGITYTYDGLGRMSSQIDYLNSAVVGYQYNAAGVRTRMTYWDGNYVGYDLDNANRIKTMGWNANSGIHGYGYNNLGQVVWEARGVGGVSYGYDGAGRLTSKTNDFNGTANDITWTFTHNPAGQIASTTSSSDVYDYEELTGITEPAQSHDGLNRISTLVGATGACPSGGYDARGSLICDGTGRSYVYDIENRLISANIAGNSLSLTYDPEGRLSSYTWNGGTTKFLYDGVNLIGEVNNSGQLLRRYVHGPGTDNPLIWYEGAGNATLRYFYTNHQGSVITTADNSGNRGDIYAYGPYGEPKDQYGFTYWPTIGTGATNVSRFGYTGQAFLADARLYHYKARVYDPQMGRFLQTDPVGSDDDLNLYAYVGGDPVNGTDPTGKCVQTGESSDGQPIYSGICPEGAAAAQIVKKYKEDPNSSYAEVEAAAVAKKQMILVAVDKKDLRGKKVDIARTENVPASRSVDGRPMTSVTIDTDDAGTMSGYNEDTGKRVENYSPSMNEIMEHEVGQHALDNVNGYTGNRDQREARAMDRENEYRRKSGNPFRRDSYEMKWTK